MAGSLKCLTLLLVLTGLLSCTTARPKTTAPTTAGLFKIAILYPNGDQKTFNMNYYEQKHMPMVAGYLGNNLVMYEIDKGIAGRMPADKIPFLAIGYFYVRDTAAYNRAIAQNRNAVVNDFKNYTNIQPVVQVSEIRKQVSNHHRP